MLFHLGSLWRMNNAALLPTLTRVASVSGGSIIAGVLGRAWRRLDFGVDGIAKNFRSEVAEPILGLAGRTLDVRAVLSGVLTRSVASRVASSYDKYLFRGATLQDLPDDEHGPRFIFLATDLGNGALFRFSRPYMRSYLTHAIKNPAVPLAQVVAASTAFPPFLSPAFLDLPAVNGADQVRLTLTDGGVYDNLGLEPVLKRCATVFVSDGGGSLTRLERPPTDWLMGTVRTLLTIHSQVGRLRRRQVVDALVKRQRAGALWAIDTPPGRFPRPASTLKTPEQATVTLAATPTRLSALPGISQHRIVNWGFAGADAALRSYFDGELPEPAGFPLPDGVG